MVATWGVAEKFSQLALCLNFFVIEFSHIRSFWLLLRYSFGKEQGSQLEGCWLQFRQEMVMAQRVGTEMRMKALGFKRCLEDK